MSNDTLPGLEARPHTLDDDYDQHAVRIIHRVKHSFQTDLDKLKVKITAGGTLLEMWHLSDAAWVIRETIRGLDLAIDRVLGHDVEEEGDDRGES